MGNDEQVLPASSDTLLGQLQQGRGAGHLWALREKPEVVHPLLVQCITNDPRWDTQIEPRSAYYAGLVISTKMDLTPLSRHLHTADDKNQFGWNVPLTLSVLDELHKRGYPGASDILVDYIGYGYWWSDVLTSGAVAQADRNADFAAAVCRRFPTGYELFAALDYNLHFMRYEPWSTWRGTIPCINRLLEEVESSFVRIPTKPTPKGQKFTQFSIRELLSMVELQNYREVKKAVVHNARRSDKAVLLEAVREGDFFVASAAFHGLVKLKLAETAYELMLEKARAFMEAGVERKGLVIRIVEDVLLAIPGQQLYDLAWRWFDSPDWYLRVVGQDLVEDRAVPEDIPKLRASLRQALDEATPDNTEVYRICSVLDALARFPRIGILPEVERAFLDMDYSYARWKATMALNINAPGEFREHYAFECLWDCEVRVRLLACEQVDASMPQARTRLGELEADPFEQEVVRDSARRRLELPTP